MDYEDYDWYRRVKGQEGWMRMARKVHLTDSSNESLCVHKWATQQNPTHDLSSQSLHSLGTNNKANSNTSLLDKSNNFFSERHFDLSPENIREIYNPLQLCWKWGGEK